MGELLPLATAESKGLMNLNGYRGSNSFIPYDIKSNDFIKLFTLSKFTYCVLNIVIGDTTSVHQNIASVYLNNRCQGSFYIKSKLIYGTLNGLYAIRNDNDDLTFYIKTPMYNYPSLTFSFDILPNEWSIHVYGTIDNSVIESDLNLIM